MYLSKQISQRNAQFIWAFLLSAALIASLFNLHGNYHFGIIGSACLWIGFLCLSDGTTIESQRPILVLLAGLFIYTILLSHFTIRSAHFALNYLVSFLFFCTLCDLQYRSKAAASRISPLAITRLVLLVLGVAHAGLLMFQYLQNPIRVTGLFLDYGQAALYILIAFSLNYRLLRKHRIVGLTVTFILFLGFFTTFSRASNFLLVLMLGMIAIAELKQNDLRRLCWFTAAIVLAFLCVQALPSLMDASVVNRGGLAEFRTLNSRLFYWDAAINAIKAAPLIGHGLGNFEFLGIKEVIPYSQINSTHSDYLQIWVDLGVFWFLLFVATVGFVVIKDQPFIGRNKTIKLDTHYLSGCLLVCLALYMTINFIIHSVFFQIVIATLIAERRCGDE